METKQQIALQQNQSSCGKYTYEKSDDTSEIQISVWATVTEVPICFLY